MSGHGSVASLLMADESSPEPQSCEGGNPRPGQAVRRSPQLEPGPDRRLRGRGRLQRGRLPARPAPLVDAEIFLRRVVGERRAGRLSRDLRSAGEAFAEGRHADARTALTPLVRAAPDLPEGRELMGLVMYRLGCWADAAAHLEAFRELSGSAEQNPVLADCHRALGNYDDVDELWRELGEVSPSAELVVEGRIVAAGAKADQGDLDGAIAMLAKGWSRPRRPRAHHLRRAYALADLYDRAGSAARARSLFAWIAEHDPRFADVSRRLRALG